MPRVSALPPGASVTPQRPPVHLAERHTSALPQTSPSCLPHLPSGSQTAEAHWVGRSHDVPFATRGTQDPALHHLSEVQSESLVHVLLVVQVCVDTSQSGVAPVHAVPLVDVHETHWFVAVLHAGAAPEHVASVAQGSHFPLFAPSVMQSPERHSEVFVHVPSPEAKPHLLSAVSQTPLAQTMAATADVQVPVIGGACPATVGMGAPLGSFGAQVPALHQFPPEQSASTVHAPAAWQTPIELHEPERQTAVAVPSVQGPSPFL